jgi:hypothetical protein
MAKKHRYGGKKESSKKESSKKSRVSAKRRAAGKKAWRTKVRRYGSKAAALAATFGKTTHHRFSRANIVLRRISYDKALARVQAKLGTTGQAPTDREKKIAARIARDVGGRRGPAMSTEESSRVAFKERLSREKRAEAARRAAYDLKVKAEARSRAEHDAAQKEAEAAIAAEYANL